MAKENDNNADAGAGEQKLAVAAGAEEKKDDAEIKIEVKPKVVTGDKTFTAQEVNDLLAENTRNSAKIVKDQLYPEITRNKDQVKELKTKLKDLEAAKPAVSPEEQKVIDDKKADVANQLATANQELAVNKEKLGIIENTAVAAVNKVNELADRLEVKDLSEHRLSVINAVRASGGNLIENMVSGKTKDEINASVELAKTEYDKVVNGVRADLKLPTVAEEKTKLEAEKLEKDKLDEHKDKKVPRLATKMDFTNWKGTRDEILKNAYRQVGVNV